MTSMRYFRGTTLRRKVALGAASGLILGLTVGVAIFGFGRATPSASAGLARAIAMTPALAGSGCDNGPRPAFGKYPADGNGDGVISDSGSERIPALIAAVAANGASGYVKYSDLFCQPAPASPAAALAAQAAAEASGGQSIPVYASDGTTIVGSLTVGGANSAASPGGSAPGKSG
jgi:hypothetical protein